MGEAASGTTGGVMIDDAGKLAELANDPDDIDSG
jgi:hypothetical protein